MYYLSIDFGTSAIKTAVVDEELRVKCWNKAEYRYLILPGEKYELRESDLMSALIRAVKGLDKELLDQVELVCYDTFSPSLVFMDIDGNLVYPNIITHLDRRSRKQSEDIDQIIGNDAYMKISGIYPFAGAIPLRVDGLMSLIPGMVILAPQDPLEIEEATKAMIEYQGPVYMRIGNPKIPILFERRPFVIGKGQLLRDGTDVTLISTGSTTRDAIKATDALAKEGISVQHIGMPTIKPLDIELVRKAAKETGKIITVEEHYINNGLGSLVTDAVADMKNVVVKRLGVPEEYAKTSGDYRELLAYYHLDATGIAESIKEFLAAV